MGGARILAGATRPVTPRGAFRTRDPPDFSVLARAFDHHGTPQACP
jgi:hypothetical protein